MSHPTLRTYLKRFWSLLWQGSTSSGVLKGLIDEVERTSGYARNDVRARAKLWLISHRKSLAARDVELAEEHFGYLLPLGWNT